MSTPCRGWLEVDKPAGQASRRIWLALQDVGDRLSSREKAATHLRALTPGWLALLRVLFPDRHIQASRALAIAGSEREIECPGHREPIPRQETKRATAALTRLIEEPEVCAALYWVSLGYEVWGESVSHAAGLVWMAIEALLGEESRPGAHLDRAAAAYVDHLPAQIADDLEETLAGLFAGTAQDRKPGAYTPPLWVKAMPRRSRSSNDIVWLKALGGQLMGSEPLFAAAVEDVVEIATSPQSRAAAIEMTRIDLSLLRATRHAIAHSGKAIPQEPLAHYLATLGCECVRALLSEHLNGTEVEGAFEGR